MQSYRRVQQDMQNKELHQFCGLLVAVVDVWTKQGWVGIGLGLQSAVNRRPCCSWERVNWEEISFGT